MTEAPLPEYSHLAYKPQKVQCGPELGMVLLCGARNLESVHKMGGGGGNVRSHTDLHEPSDPPPQARKEGRVFQGLARKYGN